MSNKMSNKISSKMSSKINADRFLLNGRLTSDIKPTHYTLHLTPNLETFTFGGKITININVDTDKYKYIPPFAIHCKDIEILSIKTNHIVCNNFAIDEDNELLVIFPDNIPNDRLQLCIEYNGVICDDLTGFYKSKHTENGVEHLIATTQFESTYARKAFPCFDEPMFKATFDIIMTHDSKYMVLSNEDVLTKTIQDTCVITEFKTTPIMSTYLVAFIVGNFEHVEKYTKPNNENKRTRIRIYATHSNIDKTDFALDIAERSLEWYENFFGVNYPMDKLDLIGIPYFKSGAMENYGLVTFRPEYLFCTDETELADKIDVAVTIAHELAHMWYGNLVTMSWWNYLWLNESMATYFAWLVCDKLFPTWNVWEMFINDEYNYALELDSLKSSHPIEFDESIVRKPVDISQVFDGISYAKGSCLVRWLAETLGFDLFKKGMQIYMKKNKWSNAKSSDLWKAFDQAISEQKADVGNIEALMHTFTTQTGYPLITYSKNEANLSLKQTKYLKCAPENSNELWHVPILINSTNCGELTVALDSKEKTIVLSNKDILCDMVLNPERRGFYRVMYDVQSISDLPFNINMVSSIVQKQVLEDMFSLALGGYQDINMPFLLLKTLDFENLTSHNVWDSLTTNMHIFCSLLKNHKPKQNEIKQFVKKYMANYAANLLHAIGPDDNSRDTVDSAKLRPILYKLLSLVDDDRIISLAKFQFKKNKYNYILDIVMQHCTRQEYDKLVGLISSTNDNPQLEKDLIRAIGKVRDSDLIDDVINNVLLSIKVQDADLLVAQLSSNEYATQKIWTFCKKHWNKISIFEESSSEVQGMVRAMGLGFVTTDDLSDYTNFFSTAPEGTDMVVRQMTERIESKILSIRRIIE